MMCQNTTHIKWFNKKPSSWKPDFFMQIVKF